MDRSRPRIRTAASVLLAVLLALACGARASAAPRSFFGVVPQAAPSAADIDRMGQGRVGTLRIRIDWSSVDPSPAADDYNWSGIDAIVAAAARNRIRVLPFFYGTPRWVAQSIDGRPCATNCATFAPHSRAALKAWSHFVADAVSRYGRKGSFWTENPGLRARPVTAWQIWNEQNSQTFYRPRPNVKAYAAVLDRAARAIRRTDPHADVVLGGMAELAGVRHVIDGSRYLAKLYRRRGARRDFDGVAPHPYGARLRGVRAQVNLVRRVMKHRRDAGTGLWITEIGWGSADIEHPLSRGARGQAQGLESAFRYFLAQRHRLHIKAVGWFSWEDSPVSICEWCASSGLFTTDEAPKPAWSAFTRLTGGS